MWPNMKQSNCYHMKLIIFQEQNVLHCNNNTLASENISFETLNLVK